jgi:hypothetical protein
MVVIAGIIKTYKELMQIYILLLARNAKLIEFCYSKYSGDISMTLKEAHQQYTLVRLQRNENE